MRTSGILMPISALPGRFGIGTLGAQAMRFVDFLQAAGQTYWQILPIGPTGYGDSPYQSFSAFAANPYFIDPALLARDGFLTEEEIAGADYGTDALRVDYGLLYRERPKLLKKAAARLAPDTPDFAAFCKDNAFWLEDYALFMALKAENGERSWFSWSDPVRLREENALAEARIRLAQDIHYRKAVQYFFRCQWQQLRAYAAQRNVRVIGDIPIYVSPDSSDLWASPELFQLDGDRRLARVAGCPPDAFAADGQLWGNPLYNWEYHRATDFSWWCRRIEYMCTVCDVVRIDHFRGFESYFSIPAGQDTARGGTWCKGPDLDFIRALHRRLPDAHIIAEDLGYLTPEVRALLEASGYPGMKLMQFAFDSREAGDYLPHNYVRNSVAYTGTHDNTTTAAWETDADPADVAFAREYLGCSENEPLCNAFIRAVLACVSDTAVIPMQDWLGLGDEARMNRPSVTSGNWQWRMAKDAADDTLAKRIRKLTALYGRLPE